MVVVLVKDISVEEEVRSFSFEGGVLHLNAGRHDFVIRRPTFIGTYVKPRKWWAVILGLMAVVIGFVWAANMPPEYTPPLLYLFPLTLIGAGIVGIIAGLITKAVITVETETGTTVTAPIPPILAAKIIEETKKVLMKN